MTQQPIPKQEVVVNQKPVKVYFLGHKIELISRDGFWVFTKRCLDEKGQVRSFELLRKIETGSSNQSFLLACVALQTGELHIVDYPRNQFRVHATKLIGVDRLLITSRNGRKLLVSYYDGETGDTVYLKT